MLLSPGDTAPITLGDVVVVGKPKGVTPPKPTLRVFGSKYRTEKETVCDLLQFQRMFRIFVVAILGIASSVEANDATMHAYTVNDLLKTEEIKAAYLDPDGQNVVFERMPPYVEISDYSSGEFTRHFRSKIYIHSLSDAKPTRLLFEQDKAGGYWLARNSAGRFSPNGSRLIVYRWLKHKVNLGVLDIDLGKINWLPFAPRFERLLPTDPVWISDEYFVFVALPKGDQPAAVVQNAALVDRLFQEWESVWQGEKPTAHVELSARSADTEANRNRAHSFKDGSLILVHAPTGIATKVADGLYSSLQLSPNGRYLAAARTAGKLQPDPSPIMSAGPLYRSQPVLFDMESKFAETVLCDACDVHPDRLGWSADGGILVFFARNFDEHWDTGGFWGYHIARGRLLHFNHNGLDLAISSGGLGTVPYRPVYIADKLAVFARPIVNEDRARDPSEIGSPNWFLLNPDGNHTNLTIGFETVSGHLLGQDIKSLSILADGNVWKVSEDESPLNLTFHIGSNLTYLENGISRKTPQVLLEMRDKEGLFWVLLNLENGDSVRIPKPTKDSRAKAWSIVGGVIVALAVKDYATQLSALLPASHNYGGGRPIVEVPVVEINRHLKSVKPMNQVTIAYTYRKGDIEKQLTSCMLLPPDWSPKNRYPLVVFEYPTNTGNCVRPLSEFHPHSLAPLAGAGYIVLYANNAPEFLRSPDGYLPYENMADIVLAAVDAAIEQGFVDADRIGLYGFSHGGVASLWLATQTNRFKAIVSSHGAANFTSHYASVSLPDRIFGPPTVIDEGMFYEHPASPLSFYGVKPWEDPVRYVQASPFFLIDRIETPILLLNADLDYHAPNQYREMFRALYRERKEVLYVEYWGEGHGTASPANIRDRTDRIIKWYDKYLEP